MSSSESRQKNDKINVCVTPTQHAKIKSIAEAMDVSMSEVCRTGIGRAMAKPVVDQSVVDDIAKSRCELNEVGVAFKAWLAGESHLLYSSSEVAVLLNRLEVAQVNVAAAISAVRSGK